MTSPEILPPANAGCVQTSRGEFFIIDEESENPAIPTEWLTIVPPPKRCPAFKVVQLSPASEKRFFCDLHPEHDSLHKAGRPVKTRRRREGRPGVTSWRVIAKWVD